MRQGFLPTVLRSAQLVIDRKNLNDLKQDFKRFEALKEGGDVPPLQVETVRNQVLSSQSTVLRDEQDVRDAYVFLMQHFQAGDAVFLFGFSRGAYTVRAVAALLHMYGLLPAGNEPLVPYAIRMLTAASKTTTKPAAGRA